ncbi:class I SAM-dependent methyltransferase [Ruegeria atlantica]|uniref:class I SAM-dependent methyltransferase n=1 Tax=Ruegeria atlantica TaxID=81569 RepID=UPI00147D1C6F|nr:class I SAM-dependent methyltransferase [Ruegeria atlantica]
MTQSGTQNETFWQNFYDGQLKDNTLSPPSQFAAFIAQELSSRSSIIDVGCGNGRDTIFFSLLNFDVTGLDACEKGIAVARANANSFGFKETQFHCSLAASDRLTSEIKKREGQDLCIYGRFFLHAITQEEQDELLGLLSETLSPGQKVAFEYRTLEDKNLLKVASPHYRRYQSMHDLDEQLNGLGFDKLYGTQGQGLAKFMDEDAHVARGIYVKADR